MEKESKIISLNEKRIAPKDGESSFEALNLGELTLDLEKKFEQSLQELQTKNDLSRESIRTELHEMLRAFEDRIAEKFADLQTAGFSERKSGLFSLPLSVTGQAKHIGNALKKMIAIPDFEIMKRSDEVDEFGLDPDFEAQILPFFRFLHHQYWRVSVHGLENIPNQGAALIVSNHAGSLPADGAMIKVAVRFEHPAHRAVRFLVEDFVYHFPFLGMGMARFGGVRACQENAERLLKNNQLVVVFPEGVKGLGKKYRDRYRIQRFGRGGVIRLALASGAPIIPTAVIGSEEIYPMLARSKVLARMLGIPYIPITPFFPWLGPAGMIPLPTKWSIYFGKPIHLNQYGPKAANDRLLVSRLNEELRTQIQSMIKEGLEKRTSVWFG